MSTIAQRVAEIAAQKAALDSEFEALAAACPHARVLIVDEPCAYGWLSRWDCVDCGKNLQHVVLCGGAGTPRHEIVEVQ